VRTDLAALTTPRLDEDLRLLEGVEDLAVEQFISKSTMEALAVAVLP